MGASQSVMTPLQSFESQLVVIGGYNHNLCCRPFDDLHPGRACWWLCPGCCGPENRPPQGPQFDAAMNNGPLRQLLDEAKYLIGSARGECCGLCPCPSNYEAQALLNSQWTPRANAMLAPFGLRVRVDAWTEITYSGDGRPHKTEYLMIRFMAGPPAALLNAIEMERAMMTGMGAVVVLSGAPKIEYAPQQQFAVQSPVHGGFAQPGMQVAPMGMQPQLYYGGGAPSGYQQAAVVPMGYAQQGAQPPQQFFQPQPQQQPQQQLQQTQYYASAPGGY